MIFDRIKLDRQQQLPFEPTKTARHFLVAQIINGVLPVAVAFPAYLTNCDNWANPPPSETPKTDHTMD